MSTVLFVYTDGVTYKASNVNSISHNESTVEYYQSVSNESGTVGGVNLRSVDKFDLLYAVVRNTENGEVTIIPGLYDSFDVVPKGESVQRQKNIDAEKARVAAYRAAIAPERNAKEKAKFEARRAKRKADYLQSTGTVVHEDADEPATVTEEVKVPVVEVREVQKVEVQQEQPVIEVQDTPAVVTTTPAAKGTRKSVNVVEQLKAAGVTDEDLATLRSLGILR